MKNQLLPMADKHNAPLSAEVALLTLDRLEEPDAQPPQTNSQ